MPLKPGQVSYIPSMPSFDRQNNRIYAMDSGPGKSVGISLDQKTSNMTHAWSADQTTLSWMILIGPANQRVLDVTYAAYGKLLAASDFFSPMSAGFEVWPGYGGLICEVLNDGHIMALKVLPKSTSSNSTSATSTSTTGAGGGR